MHHAQLALAAVLELETALQLALELELELELVLVLVPVLEQRTAGEAYEPCRASFLALPRARTSQPPHGVVQAHPRLLLCH